MSKTTDSPTPHPLAFMAGCAIGAVGAPVLLAAFCEDPIGSIKAAAVLIVGCMALLAGAAFRNN